MGRINRQHDVATVAATIQAARGGITALLSPSWHFWHGVRKSFEHYNEQHPHSALPPTERVQAQNGVINQRGVRVRRPRENPLSRAHGRPLKRDAWLGKP